MPKDAKTKKQADPAPILPTTDVSSAQKKCQALLARGPTSVADLIAAVGQDFGDAKGVGAKYTVHALVLTAGRPGADNDRAMIAGALAAELGKAHSRELKAFVVRQLQLCGGADEVRALAKLLADDRLCEPATQALLAIGGKEATAALSAALGKAKGPRRATIVKALGRLQAAEQAEAVRGDLTAAERDLRLVALYALANMPDAASAGGILAAAAGGESFEQQQATDEVLRLARRLAQRGQADQAEQLARKLMAARQAPKQIHARCAALAVLAEVAGAKAVPDVEEAMRSEELRVSAPAARTAVDLARSLMPKDKARAAALLRQVLIATKEEAARHEAKRLLAVLPV